MTIKLVFAGTTPNLYCNTAIKKSDGCNVKIFIEDFSLVLELSKFGSFSFIENVPSFVPIMFELTVFHAAHLMVITFYLRSKLWPFKESENPIPSTTDDKFLVEIVMTETKDKLNKFLKKTGAIDISFVDK